MKKKNLPKVEPVKLKPLFGMKPGVWLTILYFLAFLLTLFFLGIVPDLVTSSKRVSFTSDCFNSAVYLDGNYAGGTPFTTKVNSGTHAVKYKINGCEIDSFEIEVSKPVFFAWLFPRKMDVNSDAKLTTEAYKALVSEFLQDLCDYSAILSYDKTHRYPSLYTNFAKTIQNSLSVCHDYKEIMQNSLCFATTAEMQQDAETAFKILNIPFDFVHSSSTDSTYKAKNAQITGQTVLKTSGFSITGYTVNNSFTVARTCVTEEMYQAFIKDNPMWDKSNKEALISQGLVDDYYLEDVNFTSLANPVKNVSFYAAEAFCQWLSQISGKRVVLPSDKMWIDASSVAERTYQRSLLSISTENKPISMFGGLWEMTSDIFVPYEDLQVSDIQNLLEKYNVTGEMVVKGGSYLNSNVGSEVKGSLPKNICSDFLGFRVYWY